STATSSPFSSTRPARNAWWIVSWSGCDHPDVARLPSPPQLKHHQRPEHDAAAEYLQRREDLAEKERATDRCERRLEIHEQRGAERSDAHRRGKHAEKPGGDGGAEHNQREPATGRRRRLPVPGRERGEQKHGGRGQKRVPGDAQRIGAGKTCAGEEQD